MKLLLRLNSNTDQQGFTLVELLVVIGILGILMAVTLIAINPIQQFQAARNSQRQSDVNTLIDAIYEYEATNAGAAPANLTSFAGTNANSFGALPNETATTTSFSSPNLTLSGITSNVITDGTVTVTGCSQAADNGKWLVISGTGTSVLVSASTASAVAATGCTLSGNRIDLCTALVPTFIAAMPTDPSGASGGVSGTLCTATYTTGYKVATNSAGNRYTVNAPAAENSTTVSVTR